MIGIIVMLAHAAFVQAPAPSQAPAHVIAIHADLESPVASRAMVVLRAFVDRYPGVAAIEFHLAPPGGELRAVDRAVVAAQAQNAGLKMAELILANPGRRSKDDLVAMARQLRLDDSAFRDALGRNAVDGAVAADLAAAASAKPARPVTVAIDGQPLNAAITLGELESRLNVR